MTLADTGAETLTGGRIARAARYVQSDLVCVTYGDGLGDIDIGELVRFHRTHGKLGTITGVRPPGRFGELEIDQSGQATTFNEKPQVTDGLINGGFMVFQRGFLERYLDERNDLVLEQEPLQQLTHDGQLMVYPHEGFWKPMDTYREFKQLNELWATGHAPWCLWNESADSLAQHTIEYVGKDVSVH